MAEYAQIVVAVDPFGCAYEVCLHAVKFAKALANQVTLVVATEAPAQVPRAAHVERDTPLTALEVLDHEAATAMRELEAIFVRQGVPVVTHIVHGAPVDAVLGYVREHHTDLLVMGTHGRRGLRHALFGSVAEAVVRQAPCPVVVIRGADGTNDTRSPEHRRLTAESMG